MIHKVRIHVADRAGGQQEVLASRKIRVPQKLLSLIFGDFSEVLVLTPGKSVAGVEIEQMPGGRRE